ncbi:MAG: PH domain-containing protein [Actinomycetota bacterium]|nr:PH domain-containing protein [Actinomycetota bacterium]
MDTSGTPPNKLDPRAKTVWRLHEGISFGIALLVCIGLAVVMTLVDGPPVVWVLPLIITVIATIVWMTVVVEIMYRRWRWGVSDVDVRLQSGLVIITRTVIPMARIQHVDTSQGPILRLFSLSEVRFSTAAGKHKIPMLADADAADIRDRIAATAQVTDDGGL